MSHKKSSSIKLKRWRENTKKKKGLSAFLCPGWQQHEAHRRSTPMGERWLERSDEIPRGNARGVIHQNQPPLAGLCAPLTSPTPFCLFLSLSRGVTRWQGVARGQELSLYSEETSLCPNYDPFTQRWLLAFWSWPTDCLLIVISRSSTFFFLLSLSLSIRPRRLSALRSLFGKYLQSSSNKSSLSRGVSIWV